MKRVLAVDPGSAKCGVAVVDWDGDSTILFREIVQTSDLSQRLQELNIEFDPALVVVGDGTRSRDIQELVRQALAGVSVLVVDERDTTLRARERYWAETKRRWWRRLLPSSLLPPPVPVDDYAAVILAERALNVDA